MTNTRKLLLGAAFAAVTAGLCGPVSAAAQKQKVISVQVTESTLAQVALRKAEKAKKSYKRFKTHKSHRRFKRG